MVGERLKTLNASVQNISRYPESVSGLGGGIGAKLSLCKYTKKYVRSQYFSEYKIIFGIVLTSREPVKKLKVQSRDPDFKLSTFHFQLLPRQHYPPRHHFPAARRTNEVAAGSQLGAVEFDAHLAVGCCFAIEERRHLTSEHIINFESSSGT